MLLAEFPESGELPSHLSDGRYRRIVQGNYVVYYLPEDSGVTIIRVLHAAREEFELP